VIIVLKSFAWYTSHVMLFIYYPCKNSQAVKTGAALKSLGEKVVKLKLAAKKWPPIF